MLQPPTQSDSWLLLTPDVLNRFAKHYKTGEVIPVALVEKIEKASTFNQGFVTTEAQAAALLDLAWHTLPAEAPLQDVGSFEAAALKRFNVALPQIPPRYRSPYFTHIWSNGYSARYYSYLWTDLLDEDAYEWFVEHGGMTRANGDRFRNLVRAPGGGQDCGTTYRNFRGRESD